MFKFKKYKKYRTVQKLIKNNKSFYLNLKINEFVNKTHPLHVRSYGILDLKTLLMICLYIII